MRIFRNPFSFTPGPVTIICTLVYVALFAGILYVHHSVPHYSSIEGVDLNQAWADLKELTRAPHPYNSHQNDRVREWLLQRVHQILAANKVSYKTETGMHHANHGHVANSSESYEVVVFDDLMTDARFTHWSNSVYFEGTNIIVYIKGSEDNRTDWWHVPDYTPQGKGVLVSAHYDSVSTAYGATDDGMGIVSILQLVNYFSHPDHTPKHGLVALLNNGEEDYLNGAETFIRHPISRLTNAFLNLEGAGAGGRALLLRATDAEVVSAYQGAKHPFGNSVSQDGFESGMVASDTDYTIFTSKAGMRGLDVSFYEPRARYHTDEDDAKHTTIDSLGHMLFSSLSTLRVLTSDANTFEKGSGSRGVYFDLFGRILAVFELHILFALSVTVAAVVPAFLAIIGVILYRVDKLYLFTRSRRQDSGLGLDKVHFDNLHGFFRFPFIVVAASASVFGLAFAINVFNPLIVYSSPYVIWSMLLSTWIFVAWFLARAADWLRPTAFQRSYAIMWLFLISWILLVAVAIAADRFKKAFLYPGFFYGCGVSAAILVAWLEQFGLPKKQLYIEIIGEQQEDQTAPSSQHGRGSRNQPESYATGVEGDDHQEDEPSESTSLLRDSRRTTFARYTSPERERDTPAHADDHLAQKYGDSATYGLEQPWSARLLSSLWVVEFTIMAAVAIIFLGQLSLFATSAEYQTLTDSSASPWKVYAIIAGLSVLIVAPLGPFLHRFTYHIPTVLFAILVGSLLYNLFAFPFSSNNRLKVRFLQEVNLRTGENTVIVGAVSEKYARKILDEIPSASRGYSCDTAPPALSTCSYSGTLPRVISGSLPEDWITFNATWLNATTARLRISGRNTRNCHFECENPIGTAYIRTSHDTMSSLGPAKVESTLDLWSRTWNRTWEVDVTLEGVDVSFKGLAVCLWNAVDGEWNIPALQELRKFAPDWVAVTKMGSGLVRGYKSFELPPWDTVNQEGHKQGPAENDGQ